MGNKFKRLKTLKLSNKGFMLVETIIASTVVLSTLIALYANFNRVYTNYQTVLTYYDVDGIYASRQTLKHLIANNFNGLVNYLFQDTSTNINTALTTIQNKSTATTDSTKFIENYSYISFYKNGSEYKKTKYLIQNGTCQMYMYNTSSNTYQSDTFCEELKSLYNINNMVLLEYDKNTLEKFQTGTSDDAKFANQTFQDYAKYVSSYYDIGENDTTYSYLILTEIVDSEKTFYANIRIE